jgi:hypothetical protein
MRDPLFSTTILPAHLAGDIFIKKVSAALPDRSCPGSARHQYEILHLK